MVSSSYYNSLQYTQKHTTPNFSYPHGQHWQWTANYHHTPPNPQFLSDMEAPHTHPQMYYNPHTMFHTAAAAGVSPTEWHSPTHSAAAENFVTGSGAANVHQMLQHAGGGGIGPSSGGSGGSGVGGGGGGSSASASSTASTGPSSGGNTQLNETNSSLGEQHIAEGLPSPPITVSGSEISSPGVPASSSSPHHVATAAHHLANNNNNNKSPSSANHNNNNNGSTHNSNRLSPGKSQLYEWMKKPSYPAHPTPGKTRTKDKYRVVYTDFQRLELEKEYCTSRYITIRRKTELAQSLQLSERQVKIWFQNRRAKERKQNKKGSDAMVINMQHNDYGTLTDTKPKLEPNLHMQHSLHTINPMALGMSASMTLHSHLHSHHPLAAHTHQLHQAHPQLSAATAAAAGVSSLSM